MELHDQQLTPQAAEFVGRVVDALPKGCGRGPDLRFAQHDLRAPVQLLDPALTGERAAVVLGAASSSWGLFGQQLYGSEHWNALRAGAVAVVRADLGEAAFESWWARGEALSAAELLDYVNTGGANTGGANTGGVDTGGDGAGSTHTASGRKSAAARYPSTTHRPSTTHAPSTTHSDFLGSLSRREQEVATLVADGLTNKEIAQRLALSPPTVGGHVEHALRKLNITRRTLLAAALAGSRPAP